MRFQKIFLPLLLAAMVPILVPNTARAAEGEQGDDGSLKLSDLVQEGCTWTDGADFASRMGYFNRYVFLHKLDFNLYDILASDLAALKVCEQKLPLNAEAIRHLRVPLTQYVREQHLIAVRIGDSLYVDSTNLAKLVPEQKPTFLLHELIHSVIADGPDRMIRLKTYVKFLSEATEDTDPKQLAKQNGYAQIVYYNSTSDSAADTAIRVFSYPWLAALVNADQVTVDNKVIDTLLGLWTDNSEKVWPFMSQILANKKMTKGIDWTVARDAYAGSPRYECAPMCWAGAKWNVKIYGRIPWSLLERIVMRVAGEDLKDKKAAPSIRNVFQKVVALGGYKTGEWRGNFGNQGGFSELIAYPRYPLIMLIYKLSEQKVNVPTNDPDLAKERERLRELYTANFSYLLENAPASEEEKTAICQYANRLGLTYLNPVFSENGVNCGQ